MHCRSRGCDKKHFREIKEALVRLGLPADKIGATRKPQEFPTWDYFAADGTYSWTKQKKVSASGRKRFICGRWDHQTNDWIELKRPADAVKLFNLQTIAQALAADPGRSFADRRGREGRHYRGHPRRARRHQCRWGRQVDRRGYAHADRARRAQGRRLPRQ